MPDTKQCSNCKRKLPMSDYHRDRTRPDGLKAYCKDCISEFSKEYKSRSDVKARARERYKSKDWLKLHRAKTAVYHAVKRGELRPVSDHICYCCESNQAEDYHHISYQKKFDLDVIALCKSCHIRMHNELRDRGVSDPDNQAEALQVLELIVFEVFPALYPKIHGQAEVIG